MASHNLRCRPRVSATAARRNAGKRRLDALALPCSWRLRPPASPADDCARPPPLDHPVRLRRYHLARHDATDLLLERHAHRLAGRLETGKPTTSVRAPAWRVRWLCWMPRPPRWTQASTLDLDAHFPAFVRRARDGHHRGGERRHRPRHPAQPGAAGPGPSARGQQPPGGRRPWRVAPGLPARRPTCRRGSGICAVADWMLPPAPADRRRRLRFLRRGRRRPRVRQRGRLVEHCWSAASPTAHRRFLRALPLLANCSARPPHCPFTA